MKGAKGVEKFRERGESHGILRKAGMMITEVMKISEPPYTNRGVTRQKEDLTALIDWCQITVKGVDVFIIIEDILRIPLSFMELHGKEKGIAGHELIARFDNIKILKPTGNAQYEGFQILMSGSGCRNYENFLMMNKETWFDFLERVCRYPVNFPRIDLAIDDTKPYLSIPELIRLKNEGLISSQLRDTAENRSDRLKEDEIEAQGKTLYLGSKHSDFRITFYEKGYEQAEKFGKELNLDWNRYELRFRHKKAVRLVEELLKDRDVARIALSVLNEKVRFLQKPENSTVTRKRLYPTYPPWEELMQDVGKIKLTMNPEKKTLERTWQWLNVAVSPSLKLMDKIGKLDNRDYRVYTLLGDGEIEEGQVWEAAMFAGFHKLDNLVVVVDNNGLQIDGPIDQVCSPYPIDKKFEAFNFHVINIDAHDFDAIRGAFKEAKETKGMPTAIIAHSLKGKGVSFMEGNVAWHGTDPNDEQYAVAMADLEKVGEALCQK